MKDVHGLFNDGDDNRFSRSIKFANVEQVPHDLLKDYIWEAVLVNARLKDQATDQLSKPEKKKFNMPAVLRDALEQDEQAASFYHSLSYTYKKEFCEHIGDAKREATRQKRLEKVIDLLRNRSRLNDKYKNC